MTLTRTSAKITKFCQSEHIVGNFSLQPPSYIHSLPKILNFRQKVQNFVGGQKELTLVTLTKPKLINFRQEVQIFVGGQKELTLVTLMQNSAKITKFRQSEHIFGNFSLQQSSYIHS